MDFAVWIQDVGTFGIQVKGGDYRLERGEWYLVTDQRRKKVKSLFAEIWDGSMSIHDVVHKRLGQKSCNRRS